MAFNTVTINELLKSLKKHRDSIFNSFGLRRQQKKCTKNPIFLRFLKRKLLKKTKTIHKRI
jgi:hypothetical protein